MAECHCGVRVDSVKKSVSIQNVCKRKGAKHLRDLEGRIALSTNVTRRLFRTERAAKVQTSHGQFCHIYVGQN